MTTLPFLTDEDSFVDIEKLFTSVRSDGYSGITIDSDSVLKFEKFDDNNDRVLDVITLLTTAQKDNVVQQLISDSDFDKQIVSNTEVNVISKQVSIATIGARVHFITLEDKTLLTVRIPV